MKMFEPIIVMMNRLRYIQKISFISIIFLIPIILSSLMSIHDITKELNNSEHRLNGAYYNKLLKDLLQDTQKYRGLSISYLSGNNHFKSALEQKQLDILLKIDEIERYHVLVYDSFHTTKVNQIHKEWETINHQVLHMNVYEAMDIQNEYIETITGYMVEVSDHSQLFFTDRDYIFHIVNDVTKNLPNVTEQLGKIRGMGIALIEQGEITEKDKVELIALISNAEASLKELAHGKEVAFQSSPKLQNSLSEDTQAVINHAEKFLAYVEACFLESHNINISLEEYFTLATSVIDASFELFDMKTMEYNKIIEEQYNTLKWKRFFMFLLISLALFLTVYCLVGFYHSIRYGIEEMITTGYLFLYEYFFSPLIQKAEHKYEETEKKLINVKKHVAYQVLHAQEEERKHVSRELHDGISQTLYSILVTLNFADKEVMTESKKESIKKAKQLTVDAMNEARNIARSLRPSILDDLGLLSALKSYLEDFEESYGIKVKFECLGSKSRLNPDVETTLYRICQEALINIVKHAKADSVHVCIKKFTKLTILTISDNGVGFDLEKYLSDSDSKGIGLFSMKERIVGVKGTIDIKSQLNKGTTIEISVPTD